MKYSLLKEKLLSLFNREKLQEKPLEWGFFNEIEKDIRTIGYATNITPEVIEQAHAKNIDFLLTHHDSWGFVFGLKEECNKLLTEYHITHAFFHAPLDDADFGTNASLVAKIGLTNRHKIIPYEEIFFCGLKGELEIPLAFEEFTSKISNILEEPVRAYQNNDKPLHKVAVATGGGNMTNDMKVAVDEGCDTYITGEYVLYSQQYAKLHHMNLIVGSHTNTEVWGVESMAKKLTEDTEVEIIRMEEPNY